jgi:dCTP diphosphatase
MSITDFQRRLRDFAADRDWEQFHSPKNLVMALVGEVGELTELFQWLTVDESTRIMDDPASARSVRDELADILAYLLRLSDVLDVDLEAALAEKMVKNAAKYPVRSSRSTLAKPADAGGGQDGGC